MNKLNEKNECLDCDCYMYCTMHSCIYDIDDNEEVDIDELF